MQFEVFRVREFGRVVPKDVRLAKKVVGDLTVQEVHDRELSRTVKVARITRADTVDLLLPELQDAVLLSVRHGWWTMTGWERVPVQMVPIAFQQSWILIPLQESFDAKREAERQREWEAKRVIAGLTGS